MTTTELHVWSRDGYEFDADAVASLPGEVYGDPAVHARELRQIFSPSAGGVYLGHDELLPRPGHRRADGDDRIVLINDGTRTNAVANVCTHACRPIVVDGASSTSPRLRCAYHDWSFRADGTLIGGPGVRPTAEQQCELGLPTFPLVSWHGLHFGVGPERRAAFEADLARIDADMSERGIGDWLDLAGWTLLSSHDDPYDCDWKTFLDVFGDCYDVPPYHPGLASFADCSTIEWTFGDAFHAQFVKLSSSRGDRSSLYAAWADGLDEYFAARGEPVPQMAVAWVGIYPNLMFELYNGLRVISAVVPTGHDSFVNRVHYFVPGDMEALVPGLPRIMREAYEETVIEDRDLVRSRGVGLKAADGLGLGRSFDRYRPVLDGLALEAGVAHFHGWWRRSMAG